MAEVTATRLPAAAAVAAFALLQDLRTALQIHKKAPRSNGRKLPVVGPESPL